MSETELLQIDNAIETLEKQLGDYKQKRAEMLKPKGPFREGQGVFIAGSGTGPYNWNSSEPWMLARHELGLVFATKAERDEKERLLKWLARPKVELVKGQVYFVIDNDEGFSPQVMSQTWVGGIIDRFSKTLRLIDTDEERLEAALPECRGVFLGEKE